MGWRLIFAVLVVTVPYSTTQTCQRTRVGKLGGSIIFGAAFNIHQQAVGGQGCSDRVNADAIQRLEAAHFAVKTLNDQSFMPGITFGIRSYDDCGIASTGVQRALDYLSERESYIDESGEVCPADVMFPGFIASMYSGVTAKIATFLNNIPMATVSYASHSLELSDTSRFPYFQRLVPSASTSVQVLMSILSKLSWTHVSLLVGSDPYAQDLKSSFLHLASLNDVCIMTVQSVDNADATINFQSVIAELATASAKGAHGVIIMTIPEITMRFFEAVKSQAAVPGVASLQWIMGLPFHDEAAYSHLKDTIRGLIAFYEYSGTIPAFQEYFLSLTPENNTANPFFGSYWEQVNNCTLNATCASSQNYSRAEDYKQQQFVSETIASVYTFAHALKSAHTALCGGTPGLCGNLVNLSPKEMMKYLRQVKFTHLDGRPIAFKENGEAMHTQYGIQNIQLTGSSYDIAEVGTWVEGNLTLTGSVKMYDKDGHGVLGYINSTCDNTCTCTNVQQDNRFSRFDDGDVFILGIFNIHGKGKDVQECSKTVLQTNLMGNLEAFFYALEKVNNDPTVLPNVRLGGLVMDNCRFHPDRVLRQLSSILLKDVKVLNSQGKSIPLLGALSGITSGSALYINDFLDQYRLPHISFTSSSALLSDKAKHPRFLRVIGSDVAQAQAMVDIVKTMNWTYVTTVFSDSPYGRSGMKQFLKLAKKEGICVATQVMFEEYFVTQPHAVDNIIQYMIAGVFPEANVVVMFVSESHARAILEAKERYLGNKTNKVIWLAADAWGPYESVPSGLEKIARGAITLGFHTAPSVEFGQYLRNLTLASNTRNVWFNEFWEQHFECDLSGIGKYGVGCSSNLSLNAHDIQQYQVSVTNVVDSVYVYAKALEMFLKDACPETPDQLCSEAAASLDRVFSYMKGLEYNGSSGMRVAFDTFGDGVPRYDVFNYQKVGENTHGYKKVGTWIDSVLDLNVEKLYSYRNNDTALSMASDVISVCKKSPCKCSTVEVMDMPFTEQYTEFTLLGYFPLHAQGRGDLPCGEIQLGMYQQLLAFYYAIDQINKNATIMPGAKVGYMVWDTCSSPAHGEFVFEGFDLNLRLYNQPPDIPILTQVLAMIGGYQSDVTASISYANQRGYHLVQISPSASAVELGNRTSHPRFLRTVPPDTAMMEAMVELLRDFGWTYISIVYSNSSASRAKFNTFKGVLTRNGICIAVVQMIDPNFMSDAQYDRIIQNLTTYNGAVGVAIFANENEIRQLLLSGKRQNSAGRFVWLSGDDWGKNLKIVDGVNEIARGSFTLMPDSGADATFDRYIENLTVNSFPRDPWYKEFWEEHFQCSLQYGGKYDKACTGAETFKVKPLLQHSYTTSTINAVYAYALGLTNMYMKKCGRVDLFYCIDKIPGLDKDVKALYDEIRQLRYTGADGRSFYFTGNGDGALRYKVLNYQPGRESDYVEVGYWENGELTLNFSAFKMYDEKGNSIRPKSRCPGTCTHCIYQRPEIDTTRVPLKFEEHRSIWGVVVITVTVLGVVFAFIIMIFFIFNHNHPVVAGATSSLSFILLLGIILLYLLNFAIMFSDVWATCGIKRFGLGFFYTLIFTALLMKIIRIRRIFNKANVSMKPSFVGGPSNSLAACILLLIELVLVIEWLVLQPPNIELHLDNVSTDPDYPLYDIDWRCTHSKESLVISLVYVYLLILATLIVGFNACKAGDFQRESLCILLSTIGTILIVVAWLCVYMLMPREWEKPAVCIGITANATLILCVMFTPKMLVMTSGQTATPKGTRSTSSLEYDATYIASRDSRDVGMTNRSYEDDSDLVNPRYTGRSNVSSSIGGPKPVASF
ncbi:uncharacterized protein LOC106176781 isoform X2 [Lingula anatina]|uniref:Uncharacterized protein LOC106176781 isoform X2 n=1 Tax=Lingula anatina TaxID=7574 RepID=A0A1S3JWL5_LINAN|nr:uncharacterized protein LOC106176781 isoform X2 [Lingula anatina]|eukprot:XP_013414763.1 uncharacterized protein LOC106176781 isoform X2 [Lingula anatina]